MAQAESFGMIRGEDGMVREGRIHDAQILKRQKGRDRSRDLGFREELCSLKNFVSVRMSVGDPCRYH